MRASARNHLRIDFEGLSGTVKIDSLQFYRLFTVETMDSDQVMHFFSQKQGVEQDDEGRYVYQQKGAQIIGGQFQGKRTVNPYAVFAEVLFVLILMGYGNPRVKRMIIDADRGLYSCYGILAEEAKAIVSFYSGWYCLWIFVTGLLVLGYGFKVFSYSVSIDTEIGMVIVWELFRRICRIHRSYSWICCNSGKVERKWFWLYVLIGMRAGGRNCFPIRTTN